MSLRIQLHQFDGPLSLLLHLITREEMNIFDINISEITQQYVEVIEHMRRLDLEVAGEFIAMAATLLQIKSHMLLPSSSDKQDEMEDPRRPLVERLLDYQRFQKVAEQLAERPRLGRDYYRRVGTRLMATQVENRVEGQLFELISAYRAVSRRKIPKFEVAGRGMSLEHRILELGRILTPGSRLSFWQLMASQVSRGDLVVTFLALLELCRLGYVSLTQVDVRTELWIELASEVPPSLAIEGWDKREERVAHVG